MDHNVEAPSSRGFFHILMQWTAIPPRHMNFLAGGSVFSSLFGGRRAEPTLQPSVEDIACPTAAGHLQDGRARKGTRESRT